MIEKLENIEEKQMGRLRRIDWEMFKKLKNIVPFIGTIVGQTSRRRRLSYPVLEISRR